MKENIKKTWEDLYSKTDFEHMVKRIDYSLKIKKDIFQYYPWLDILRRNNLKIDTCLEVGSGTGAYSLILKKLGFTKKVYLLDWSDESLNMAKKLFKKYNEKAIFVCGDALNLPFKDKSFNLTISGGLIEHFNNLNMQRIIEEKKRVSNYVLTQAPISTPPYWIMRTLITIAKQGWPFGYEKPLTRSKLEDIYIKAGLKILDEDYHDVLTAVKFTYGVKKGKKLNFKKNWLNKCLKNEMVLLGLAD